jgi:hypothetical protein
MQKEIFEQPRALADTLEMIGGAQTLTANLFGVAAPELFKGVGSVLILACGTSFHAGLVARYWIEQLAGFAVFGGDCQRVPLPVFGAGSGATGGGHFPVGRNGGYAGLGAPREGAGHGCAPWRSAMCRNRPSCANARLRFLTRAGPGDRRGLDQGLHHPAWPRCSCWRRRWPSRPGGSMRRRRRRSSRRCATCRWRCRRCWRSNRKSRPGRSASRTSITRLFLGRGHHLPDRAGRRAEAQGDFLHPRRGLSGGRAEARPAGAGG